MHGQLPSNFVHTGKSPQKLRQEGWYHEWEATNRLASQILNSDVTFVSNFSFINPRSTIALIEKFC